MFNKLMSSLGLQGIQVDTRLHTTAPQAGQAIQGEVIFKGAASNKIINGIYLKLMTTAEVETDDAEYNSAISANIDKDITELSRMKWQWMADKDVTKLQELFHKNSEFVHMGGTWGKEQEINIIQSGNIWYKKADIHEVSVKILGNTAIVYNRITLLAVVGGNEVTNNFMVTEVYVKEGDNWKMGSMSFTKLIN